MKLSSTKIEEAASSCALNDHVAFFSLYNVFSQVEQLKEFARRANIERDECVMRERATSRKRGEGGCSDVISGGSGIRGGGRGGMVSRQVMSIHI